MAQETHTHFRLNGKKAWIIAVNMGYGHQRAAYPLKIFAYKKKVINANNYPGIPAKDRRTWETSRHFYEFISRFKKTPIIGQVAFDLFDRLQSIPAFYPKRDLSDPSMQVKTLYRLIRKKDWGKHLMEKLRKHPLPLITTFFAIAFMAEEHDYPEDIYVLATDTDISRAWVALRPNASRIKYFAPNIRVYERLKAYGVCPGKIYLTGFPLPDENIGDHDHILKQDLAQRLCVLDPLSRYHKQYRRLIEHAIEPYAYPEQAQRPLTLMFAIGGAGAQKDIAMTIVKSLKQDILKKRIKMILVAGIHNHVYQYFKEHLRDIGLKHEIGKSIQIIHARNKETYFSNFNRALRQTDILWTKPSELSFYTALGIPIIMSPTIGSQEKFNRQWLFTVGSGIDQENPHYTHEWLFDWLESGWFAEAAMQGYLEAPRHGTYNIQKIIAHKEKEIESIKSILQY